MEMEPKILSSDAPDQTARSRRVRWLPGILSTVVALIALLALGGAASNAQSGPEGTLAEWTTDFCQIYGMQCAMGDFDGDGKDDIIQFNHAVSPAGTVWVAVSNGTGFEGFRGWNSNSFCEQSGDICKVGDFDRDGVDDIVRFRRSTGDVAVAISTGSSFENSRTWLSDFCRSGEICDVGDYNGDGWDDVARFTRNTDPACTELTSDCWGKVYVAISDGTWFYPLPNSWIRHFCSSYYTMSDTCGTGDFNGDNKDDVVVFNKNDGVVWVALSTGSSFGKSRIWTPTDEDGDPTRRFCAGQETCGVGDFNGDNKDDIITYVRSLYSGKSGWVYVALSNGSSFLVLEGSLGLWATGFCLGNSSTGNEICGSGNYLDTVSVTSYSHVSRTGDFNGGSYDDIVAFAHNVSSFNPPGYVYVKLSDGQTFVESFPPPRWVVSMITRLTSVLQVTEGTEAQPR